MRDATVLKPSDISILIVEDELIVARDLSRRLNGFGYQVCGIESTGEDALQRVTSDRPDLVIMDICIKGELDGIQTAEQIRQLINIPVIYLTAYSDPATLDRAKLTGPFGYLLKPIEERDLLATIEMALYRHTLDRKLAASEHGLQEAQRIGKIGNWELDVTSGEIAWSDELFRLFQLNPAEEPPGFDTALITSCPGTADLAEAVQTSQKTGQRVELDYEVHLPGGQCAWHSAIITPIADLSGRVIKLAGIIQDVTERKRHEEQITSLNRLYGMLSHTNKAIVRTNTRDELFQEICRVAITYGGFKMAWIGLLDETSLQVIPAAAHGDDLDYLQKIVVTVRDEPSGRGPIGVSIRSGEHYVCNDFLNDPRILPWRVEAEIRGFASLAAFPLTFKAQTIGSLALYSGTKGFFTEQLVALLQEVSDDISYALYNLDQEERRRRAEKHLRTLSTVVEQSPVSISITDLSGRITYTNPAFSNLTGFAPDEALGETHGILKSGETPPEIYRELWSTITAGNSWQGELLNRKKSGEQYWEWAVIAPVQDEDSSISGFVSVKEDITRRVRREEELTALDQVSKALRSLLTKTEMIPVIFHWMAKLLKVQSAALVIVNPDGVALIEQASGAAARWSGQPLPAGEEIIRQVMASGLPVIEIAATTGTRFNITENGFLLPAVACVPFSTRDTTLGAFYVARNAIVSTDDLHLLSSLADMAASSIHRAMLHEKTEQRLARLSTLREIDLAISSTLDLRITLAILMDKMVTQLGMDAADILLLDPRNLTLTCAACRGRREQDRTPRLLNSSYAGQAAREQCPVTIPDLAQMTDPFAQALIHDGFCSYHAVPLISKGIVKGVIEMYSRKPFAPDNEMADFLESLALQTAIAIENDKLFEEINRSNMELLLAYDTTIEGWARALDKRDSNTEGHSRRVTEMTLQLARHLGVSGDLLVHIRRGALLHDIGKMAIPDSILLKPGPLNDEEWITMRRHPEIARDLLQPISFLQPALDIPLYHHERWDGAGYPYGLKGEEIPLAARIFAVVDIWDATGTDRPYRPAWPRDKVMDHLRSLAGTHLDPRVVDLFLTLEF